MAVTHHLIDMIPSMYYYIIPFSLT